MPAFCYWGAVKSDFKHEAETVVSFSSAKIQKSYPYTHFITAIDTSITITILTDNKKKKILRRFTAV